MLLPANIHTPALSLTRYLSSMTGHATAPAKRTVCMPRSGSPQRTHAHNQPLLALPFSAHAHAHARTHRHAHMHALFTLSTEFSRRNNFHTVCRQITIIAKSTIDQA
eukprot:363456-Chlamydomonas_euryale.AAC.5